MSTVASPPDSRVVLRNVRWQTYYVQSEALVRGKDEIDLAVDPPPDLAIEIDITSSSVNQLEIYAGLGVPEVWSHDGEKIVVHRLEATGEYSVSDWSATFPSLPLAALNRFLEQRATLSDTQLLRLVLEWIRAGFGSR
ncbi:MAG: Uma2 family endonuclease [Planctomycetes bacterium]|nr:Uma2 family endonuclease [Planctomycetota bacterium]